MMRKAVKQLFDNVETSPVVLVVDDHPINRDLLLYQLKLLGLQTQVSESGDDALVKWQEWRFVLVITDCHMPGMDGYALAHAIRKIETEKGIPHTPIIAWTADALDDEAQQRYSAGMDDVLVKPASLLELRKIMVKWLGHPDP